MQTVWKGALSFGLVNVPVSLHVATRKSRVSFRQLHAEDKAPVKQVKTCSKCGKHVGRDEIAKGAEVADDTYVVLTDAELDEAEPESSRTLRILEFVSAGAVDPVWREASYALAPQPGAERAYALLLDALSRRGEVAVGRLTMRSRERPVAIRAGDRLLFVDVLHYADEVRDLGEIERKVAGEATVTPEEAELADVLIERMHRDWDPAKFRDEYEERVRALVSAKARGETFHAPSPATKPATADLLAALRETLRAQGAETEA